MTDVAYQIEKLEEKAANLKNAVSIALILWMHTYDPLFIIEKIPWSSEEVRGSDFAEAWHLRRKVRDCKLQMRLMLSLADALCQRGSHYL